MTAWVILKCEGALAGYPALFMIAELSTAPKPPQEMRTTAFTVFAQSARASKLIGSTVYTGDTSIGQIEDVLVDLDHETLATVILSVGASSALAINSLPCRCGQVWKIGPIEER